MCLDRTNWKFGNKHINYLVLSWRISKTISLPLIFVDLDKAGNSNTSERIDLLQKFNKSFGFDRIKSLMADREFVGSVWFQKLFECKIPFFIRIKENSLLPWGEESVHAQQFFEHLNWQQSRLIEKEMYNGTAYFAGTKSESGDLVIVMTNQPLKALEILKEYRKRWSIEELFRKLKSSGFHWENTHMKASERLVSLLIILCFALLIAYLMAQDTKIPWRKTLKCPLYSVFKQGLINFQFMVVRSIEKTIQKAISLIVNANSILFQSN